MAGNGKKEELMHQLFGVCSDHTCGECSNFVSGRYHSKILRKCEVYGLTHSEATDWAKRYVACGMFNQEYKGRPIIEVKRHMSREVDTEPLEGQVSFDGL